MVSSFSAKTRMGLKMLFRVLPIPEYQSSILAGVSISVFLSAPLCLSAFVAKRIKLESALKSNHYTNFDFPTASDYIFFLAQLVFLPVILHTCNHYEASVYSAFIRRHFITFKRSEHAF
jgi:hypothetical protein